MSKPPPTEPYQPADLEFAAELLSQGESLDVVRQRLVTRGLPPDAVTLLVREIVFGQEPSEDKPPHRTSRWCLVGGSIVLGLGLLLLVLGVTGVFPNEASTLDGVRLTLAGLLILAYGEFVG